MTEAELREAYRGVMARSRGGRAACPAPEAIQALAQREGPEPPRLATLDHVMACADCRAELDLLRSLEEAGARSGAAARAARPRWVTPASLAAALLLAVGLGRLALRSPDDTTGAPVTFAWRPVERASRYRLEVLTESGDLAVEAETHDTAVTPTAAGRLAPGNYRWWVTATTPAPGPRSELRRLRLTTE